MKEKLNIEQLFKSKFDDFTISPSDVTWKKTLRTLKRKQFMRFNPRKINLYYSLSAIILGTGLSIAILNSNNFGLNSDNSSASKKNHQNNSEEINNPGNNLSQQSDQSIYNQNVKENNNKPGEYTERNDPTSAGSTDQNAANTIDQNSGSIKNIGPEVNALPPGSKETNMDNNQEQSNKLALLSTYFYASVYDGCAPLKVKFINTSLNAIDYTWDFGNGLGKKITVNHIDSIEKKTETLYTEPGIYTVTLIASDASGHSQSHAEQITVHPGPRSSFEIIDHSIYNYTSGANDYKWYLIPNSGINHDISALKKDPVSTIFQPVMDDSWFKKTSKMSRLLLISTNSFGCIDTLSEKLALPESEGLRFPNVFSPNPYGGNGGYYNLNELRNEVFHPVYDEKPEKYYLKIYSKAGELIFSSQKIEIGWDGYFNETAVAMGVYIFQCTGNWKNGEAFNYRGDVTVLWAE